MSPLKKKFKSSTNLLPEPSTNSSISSTVDLSQKPITDPSPKLPRDSPTKPLINTSMDPFTDPSAISNTDPSGHSFTIESSENLVDDVPKTPVGIISTDSTTDTRVHLHEDPFFLTNGRHLFETDCNWEELTLSMKKGFMPEQQLQLQQFDLGNVEEIENETNYPLFENVLWSSKKTLSNVEKVVTYFRNNKLIDTNDIDIEVERIQKIFDEFGQMDPGFPPALIGRFLKEGYYLAVFCRIINWAILTNLATNGELRYTMLPSRVVALFRDIDSQSSKEHQILSRKWVRLTFGLLKGGYAQFAASDEWRYGMDRIKRFLVKLLGPYFRETSASGKSFSSNLDNILLQAIPMGYILFGCADECRWDWDWDWLKPQDYEDEDREQPDYRVVWDPVQKKPIVKLFGWKPKEKFAGPFLPFTKSPALLLLTDSAGALSESPVTAIPANREDRLDRVKTQPKTPSSPTPGPTQHKSTPPKDVLNLKSTKPADEPSSKPVDKPSPKPVDKPSPKPVDKPSPKLVDEPSPKPADEPSPKPVDEPSPKPVDEQ